MEIKPKILKPNSQIKLQKLGGKVRDQEIIQFIMAILGDIVRYFWDALGFWFFLALRGENSLAMYM